MCEGHWLAAREAIERLRPDLTESPQLPLRQVQQMRNQVDYWIGLCYGLSGNADRQLEAFRRAVAIDPLFTPAHAGIAEILLASGQINSAIDEYRQVVKSEGAGTEEWTPIGPHAHLQEPSPQRRGAVTGARWTKSWTTWPSWRPNSAAPAILRAEVMVQQGHADIAERYLEDLHEKNPTKVDFWTVLSCICPAAGTMGQSRKAVG